MTEAAGLPGLYIGFDLGTSGLKAIALDQSGQIVASARSDYPTSRPAANAAEQSPQDWITAVGSAAAQLAAGTSTDRWRAIGLSGMIPTLVTVGADGEPVGQAITWQDSRAEEQAESLRERCGSDDLYQITGQRLDGRYLLPMFLRLAETEPARAARTASLLGAKDFIFGRLTGLAATDPSTAAGFGCYELATGRWNDRILAAASVTGQRVTGQRLPALPPVLAATTTRPLLPEVASWLGCGQIPVCLGAADSVLGALGLGVRAPGQIAYVAGTSTVILGITEHLLLDPLQRFLVTPLGEPGRWGLEMDLLATGSALRWLADLLGGGLPAALDEAALDEAALDEAALIALAAGIDPADAPLVLPYLSPGEQGALWDPLLHGTVTGLTLGHGRQHLARGLVNGILLEARRCLGVLDETGRFDAELWVAGGSAAEPAFRADLADATGRRVSMPVGQDQGFSALGAALLAAQSVGYPVTEPNAPSPHAPSPHTPFGAPGPRIPSGPSIPFSPNSPSASKAGSIDRRPQAVSHAPDSRRAATWDGLWARYEQARSAITPMYHAVHPTTWPDSSGVEVSGKENVK